MCGKEGAVFAPNTYAYRDGFSEAHALAHVLYRLNQGKNYYAIVFELPYDLKLVSDRALSLGIKRGCFGKDIRNKLFHKVLSVDDYHRLYNAVYYDLDSWLYSQWEGYSEIASFGLKRKYRGETLDKSKQYARMRQTKMKEFYYVRYNQSVICLGKNVSDMKKLAFAVVNKLKRFEGIDIEVPKVVDVRKDKICFHNFVIRLVMRYGKYVAETRVKMERCKAIKADLKKAFKQVMASKDIAKDVFAYNKLIGRFRRDFRYATRINDDFGKIARELDIWCYHQLTRDNRSGYHKKDGDSTVRVYRGQIIKTLYGTTFFAPHMKKR